MSAAQDNRSPLTTTEFLLLGLFTATMFLVALGSARSLTGHESYVAQGAREMLASGDWLVPRVAGRPWLEKPPLTHWCVAVVGLLTGVDPFTARLPSALCGWLGVMLLADLVARGADRRLGWLTGFVASTSVYLVTYARLCEADVYLWTVIMAALAVFARAWLGDADPWRWPLRLGFFALLGLTQFSKGPLFGAAIILMPVTVFLASQPDRRAWTWLTWLPGWGVAGVLGAVWPVAVLTVHPEAAELWWWHTLGRLGTDTCINPEPWWYYFTTLPWQILPWTACLFPGVITSVRRAGVEPRGLDRLMLLWLVVPFVVLSLTRAKHHHYLIHALPPCAYWAAASLPTWGRFIGRFWHSSAWQATFGMLALTSLLASVWFGRWQVIALVVLTLASLYAIGAACGRERFRLAATFTLTTLAAVFTVIHTIWMPRSDVFAPETRLLANLATERPIVVYSPETARALLYLAGSPIVCDSIDEVRDTVQRVGDVIVVTCPRYEQQLADVLTIERLDQTPQPRWRHRADITWLVVCRASPR